MGRTKGSKNLKTLEKEAKANTAIVEKPIKPVGAFTVPVIPIIIDKREEFLVDGAMLKRWLQGVKANYKETKSSDEKYLQLVNEILDYLKRMEHKETVKYDNGVLGSHATKETSNIEARNNTATD